jgi:hypothetical protein
VRQGWVGRQLPHPSPPMRPPCRPKATGTRPWGARVRARRPTGSSRPARRPRAGRPGGRAGAGREPGGTRGTRLAALPDPATALRMIRAQRPVRRPRAGAASRAAGAVRRRARRRSGLRGPGDGRTPRQRGMASPASVPGRPCAATRATAAGRRGPAGRRAAGRSTPPTTGDPSKRRHGRAAVPRCSACRWSLRLLAGDPACLGPGPRERNLSIAAPRARDRASASAAGRGAWRRQRG